MNIISYPIDKNNPDNVGVYLVWIKEEIIDVEVFYDVRERITYADAIEHPIIWIYDINEAGECPTKITDEQLDEYRKYRSIE